MENVSKQQMKILVVTTSLGTGGAEMALFRVLNVLRHHGVQPLVISIMAVQGKHFPLAGVEIRTLDMPRARLTLPAILKARRIVREFQPDLIQGWMYHSNVLAHLLRVLAPLGQSPQVEEKLLESYAVISAMGPTYFGFQFAEVEKLANTFGLNPAAAREAMRAMLHGTVDLLFSSDLPREKVLDLVPVRPLAEQEGEIVGMLQRQIGGIYAKLTS